MMKKYVFGALAFSTLMISGCGSASETNTAANVSNGNINSNVLIKVDPKDLPPGHSVNGMPPGNSVLPPGSAANAIPKGVTPTPGIDPANARIQPKPGATPTPGIPSPEEMRRIMQQQRGNTNANVPPPPPSSGGSMMKKKRPGLDKSNSNN